MGDPCKLCVVVQGKDPSIPFVLSRCPKHMVPLIIQRAHSTEEIISLHTLAPAVVELIRDQFPISLWNHVTLTLDQGKSVGHNRWHVRKDSPYRALDQSVADLLTREAGEAVKLFQPDRYPNLRFEAVWTQLVLTDEDVDRRLRGFQLTVDREIARLAGFEYDGWDWRFQTGWEDRHSVWVEHFKAYAATPEGDDFLREMRARRYDLFDLPREAQRALVSRWQRIWEDNEQAKEYLKRLQGMELQRVELPDGVFDVYLMSS